MTSDQNQLGGFRDDPKAFEGLSRELAPKLVSYRVANGSDYATATEANVKVRIFRAKEKLRPLLRDVL